MAGEEVARSLSEPWLGGSKLTLRAVLVLTPAALSTLHPAWIPTFCSIVTTQCVWKDSGHSLEFCGSVASEEKVVIVYLAGLL